MAEGGDRLIGVLTLVAGAGLVLAAILQRNVSVPLLLIGLPLFLAGIAMVTGDVLADHPVEWTERDELEEQRRRRGAAGWQKPVRPPTGRRPGGLPPRSR